MITYGKNHKIKINNYQKSYYIGSQTEAMISYLVKSIKGYGAKVYNFKTFINMFNLGLGYIKKLKPIDIYCDQVFKSVEIKKSYFAESLWIKGKNNNWTEPIEQYDTPIMNGKNSRISTIFYHLVNNTKFF